MKYLIRLCLLLTAFACGQTEEVAKNDLTLAKDWFLKQTATDNSNFRFDWNNANTINELNRVIFEIPVEATRRQSVKAEGAKMPVPLKHLLLIYKNPNGYSYAVAEFLPNWDYAFASNFGKGGVSLQKLSQYQGAILFKDAQGNLLNGYQFDKKDVKGISSSGKQGRPYARVECGSITYDYYVQVCSSYGCTTRLDYSETKSFCYLVSDAAEFISSDGPGGGGGGGGSGGSGGNGNNQNPQSVPTSQELDSRLGASFLDKFVAKLKTQSGKLCTENDVLNYVFQNLDASMLVDDYQSMGYPIGHPHNHPYTFGFGVKVGKESDPYGGMQDYDYNGDVPDFGVGSKYGSVTNPGGGVTVINTCTGNDRWYISFHLFIKSIG